MNIDQQNIIAAADSLLRQSSAAAIYLPLSDDKSLYMGSPADIASMLPDQNGAAVRGEAPNLTEAELDAMPKRAAFIAWAKDRALDTTETKDAWGQRAFLHDHIETMWIGWFNAPVSARAADAPSDLRQALADVRHAIQFSHDSVGGIDKMPVMMHQSGTVVEFIDAALSGVAADAPSESSEKLYFVRMTKTDGWREASEAAYWTFSEVNRRILYESRAADALDSQPTAPNGWISVNDRLPAPSVMVMVWQPRTTMNYPDDILINFDCIDPEDDDANTWQGHNNWRDEVACIAKPPGSIVPPHDAPYTHWQPIPADPASSQPTDGGVRNG